MPAAPAPRKTTLSASTLPEPGSRRSRAAGTTGTEPLERKPGRRKAPTGIGISGSRRRAAARERAGRDSPPASRVAERRRTTPSRSRSKATWARTPAVPREGDGRSQLPCSEIPADRTDGMPLSAAARRGSPSRASGRRRSTTTPRAPARPAESIRAASFRRSQGQDPSARIDSSSIRTTATREAATRGCRLSIASRTGSSTGRRIPETARSAPQTAATAAAAPGPIAPPLVTSAAPPGRLRRFREDATGSGRPRCRPRSPAAPAPAWKRGRRG